MDASQPLTDRSTNTHLASNADHEKAQDLKNAPATINSMEYHRQVLQGKLESGDKYVFLTSYGVLFMPQTANRWGVFNPGTKRVMCLRRMIL